MVLSAAEMTLGTDNADEQILWAIGHLCVSLPPQCLGRLEDMLLVVTPCASLVPACVAFVVLPVPTDYLDCQVQARFRRHPRDEAIHRLGCFVLHNTVQSPRAIKLIVDFGILPSVV